MAIEGFTLAMAWHQEDRAAAFEALLRAHERLVLRTAWRILGSLADAQDAAQEVFLRLHRHFERIEGSSVQSWLYRTTVNVCFDVLRRRRPEQELDLEPPARAEQLEMLEAAERKTRLAQAIRRLPEKERAALVLREIEGLETARVAEILGVSEVTVRSQVSTAKSKLREWLR